MFKLALKNIKSKPLRTIATILAIAVVVAMIFCMLSFKRAVFDFIYATETAGAGDSHIVISTNSGSDRITSVAQPLRQLDGVERITLSLTLYALLDGEYVQLRGFEKGHIEDLQTISVVDGEIESLNSGINEDNVVVSKSAAQHFGLKIGNRITLSLGENTAHFYVCAIAEQDGYFLDDAPFLFVGLIKRVSMLLSSTSMDICNEIYVKAKASADVGVLVSDISSMDEYANMLVRAAKDDGYVAEQTDSLTAPVVLAGAAVLFLGIAIIVMLFLMSEKEKTSLIAKLTVVGATKKQLFSLFLIESGIIAGIGAIIGSALAVGVFVGLIKLTLSSTVLFDISVAKLFGAAILGLISAVASSVIPILRSLKSTVRQLDFRERPKWMKVLPLMLILLTAISVGLEFCLPSATKAMSVVSLALSVVTLGFVAPSALRLTARASRKIQSMKVASCDLERERRFSRSAATLTLGTTVSVMLFMAWSLTTGIFGSYVGNFENMAFLTNIQSTVDVEEIEKTEGVQKAVKMVWGQGELNVDGKDKTMNMLGSSDVLDLVNFEYITPKDTVDQLILTDEPYVFVDIALKELYGVNVGDALCLTLGKTTQNVVVGGLLKHELFSGNYIVMSSRVIDSLFAMKPDTVLIVSDGDIHATVGALRQKYADKNYYVIETLEAYRWDMESMNAVFDLIGTLSVAVAVFVFAVSAFASLIGRGGDEKNRTALLNAGMSKNMLLKTELAEHFAVAAVSFVLSFAISALLTVTLIHALRLFGLYFEFMYETWVALVVAGAMSLAYALLPLVFNFKKGYNIKKN